MRAIGSPSGRVVVGVVVPCVLYAAKSNEDVHGRYDHHPGPITPRFVQWVLDHPRYAGLALYKREIVGCGQWPAYITPREHKHLKARVREYRSPRLAREPFLLAHLASCGLCGSYGAGPT